MKRVVVALFALALATSSFAGMTYQFKTVTDQKGAKPTSGVASVEGGNARLEYTKGDGVLFKDGTVVISKNGGDDLYVLDPKSKTYYEFSIEELAGAVGAMGKAMGPMFQMNIENPNVTVEDAGAAEAIEGMPTRKYLVNTSYDMTMKIMGMKSKSRVESNTEMWTTDKVGAEYATFIQNKAFKTGMEELDELIAKQAKAFKGFPLKQVITTRTTSGKKTQTSTTTLTVSGIKKTTVAASQFEVPAGYEESDAPVVGMQ